MATNAAMTSGTIIENSEWRWVFNASALLIVIITLPFIVAYGATPPGSQFMGMLNNPIDGATYLADMQQGYSGAWLFHLPYTPEPHRGVFLFTFFLAMGHLARLLNLPLTLVFHAARLVSSLLMFVTIYQLVADFTANITQRRITWGMAIVGGGLGWLALLLGKVNPVPPDILAQAEAFPIQAAYTNAHFPLAIAIAAWMGHALYTVALVETDRWPRLDYLTMSLAVGTLILISIAPYGLIPLGIGYAAVLVVLWRRRRAFPRREMAWANLVLIFGIPLAAYNGWAISEANPEFHGWMQQNVTLSPPVWDYLIAFGLLLLLAAIGVGKSRHVLETKDVFLLTWIVSAFLLAYAPLGVQRRFLTGINAPLAIYAGVGLWRVVIPSVAERLRPLVLAAVLLLGSLSTILAIAIPLIGVRDTGQGFYFYVTSAEIETLNWLQANAKPADVVLASPEFSLFVSTRGVRIVYGHEHLTPRAGERLREVEEFYKGVNCDVTTVEGVTLVVVGRREQNLAGESKMCSPGARRVFISSDGAVSIYAISGD